MVRCHIAKAVNMTGIDILTHWFLAAEFCDNIDQMTTFRFHFGLVLDYIPLQGR